MTTLDLILKGASSLGFVATTAGAYLAHRSIKANHDWNRRQAATALVEKWNPCTNEHRRYVEEAMPGIIDFTISNSHKQIMYEHAWAIYNSKPDTKEFDLKFHLIELLNHFELIAVSYENQTVDRRIIEDTLKEPLILWHSILYNFIEVVQKNLRNKNPWLPFVRVVCEWKKNSDLPLYERAPTDG